MMMKSLLFIILGIAVITNVSTALRPGSCEVCLKVIKALDDSMPSKSRSNEAKVRAYIEKWCRKVAVDKQDKNFCWKIGAAETSASSILGKLAQPLSRHIPPDRICERLHKADGDICSMSYPKPIDLSNLKKMRVKQLRQVLNQWGEDCRGCVEKSHFVRKIEEVRHKYEKKEDL